MSQQTLRKLSQGVFLALGLAILLFVITLGRQSIHNICPYSIVCFGLLKGNLINFSVGVASLGIFIGLLFMLLSIWYGRVFCAYICPLGTLQELTYSLRRKKPRQHVAFIYERRLAKFKYIVLLINAILVLLGVSWLYINFCPIYGLSRLPTWAMGGLLVFAMILLLGLCLERFWCRYLCPYAALLNLSQKLGKVLNIPRRKVYRNLERCIDCGLCSQNCPMNLDILAAEYVEAEDCIHCLRCTLPCPKPGTISIRRDNA